MFYKYSCRSVVIACKEHKDKWHTGERDKMHIDMMELPVGWALKLRNFHTNFYK